MPSHHNDSHTVACKTGFPLSAPLESFGRAVKSQPDLRFTKFTKAPEPILGTVTCVGCALTHLHYGILSVELET
jgi:hypothetical protein